MFQHIFFQTYRPGSTGKDTAAEDLERQTFASESLDIVVTQDVFEHVLDPAAAFKEVARTLKPGGVHVFTIPSYYWKPTLVRAVSQNGAVRHLAEPDYHGNPIDPKGSLVVTEWGVDFCDLVYERSRLTTTAVHVLDRYRTNLGVGGVAVAEQAEQHAANLDLTGRDKYAQDRRISRPRSALDYLVERIDLRLALVGGCRPTLARPAQRALGYARALVAELPVPIPLRSESWSAEPRLRAFFARPGRGIEGMFTEVFFSRKQP